MDERGRRKAANESVFREVNERIEELRGAFAIATDEPLQIVCECDRLDCTQRFGVPVSAYERVRAESACFLVIPGHVDPEVENIVDSGGGYVIVRKRRGEPAEIAEQTDPRN